MKKKKWMVLMAVITMLALAACSNATGETATEETVTIPETSSEEVLVDSLKYLLNDGTVEAEQTAEEQMTEEQTAEVQVSETQLTENQISVTQAVENQKVETQEEEIVYEEVTIYYGNGASSELNTEVTEIEQLTAENLIAVLAKHNIVSLDTKVNAFEEQETDGEKMIYLDLSKAFREYLKTMTQEGESIIIASLTDTFLEAYDADALIIMIEGVPLETSNASYAEPLTFCETEQVLMEEQTTTEKE
ncbi:MAG: hypothetical protein J6B68_09005 [Lachnospiraceae bacterium]|nr:hypothetical protein [Lachnospiraceae bacterium]